MISIKLAARTIRKLKSTTRSKSLPIARSTLLTTDGPAVGTIWWMSKEPNEPPLIVTEVTELKVMYADGGFDWLDGFLREVDEGRYVLIGTEQSVSHSFMP